MLLAFPKAGAQISRRLDYEVQAMSCQPQDVLSLDSVIRKAGFRNTFGAGLHMTHCWFRTSDTPEAAKNRFDGNPVLSCLVRVFSTV